MIIYLLTIGLISILGQVVLLRELNVSFFGVELIYLLAIGIWLFWTAAGAMIGRKFYVPSLSRIAALFVIFAIILPLDIVFIRSSRLFFGGIPGAYLDFTEQLLVLMISILPAGLLSGLLFQWTAKAYVATGKTLALAYAIESAGGILGGLLSTVFIHWGIANYFIALACALVSVIAPVAVLSDLKTSYPRHTAMVLICLFPLLFWSASSVDRRMTAWNHPHLLAGSDSPYGRITVTKLGGQISVFENDALSFETEGTDAEYFTHLVALQHPNPRNILILGGGIEGLIGEIDKYRPQSIDYVELNPVLLDLVKRHLPDNIGNSLKKPNVRIILDDPRRYLRKSRQYDLILVGMPEPSSGQTNRFYTKEFFKQCSDKLHQGGIIGFRLRTAENLWTKPLTSRNSSIYAALKSVFPEVLFLPGTTSIVTASHQPLPDSPDIMNLRFQNLNIQTNLISPHYIHYLFTNDRFLTVRDMLREGHAHPNTDIKPVCYQYAFIIWLSKFFPSAALIDQTSIIHNAFLRPLLLFLFAGLPVLFLFSRFRPGLRRTLLVALAGFTGMTLEIVLILYYQVKHGVLYQDIGLLLMSFMAGLALGAFILNKKMSQPDSNRRAFRRYGVILLIAFCLVCAMTGAMIGMSVHAGILQIAFLLSATGFLVAGIFAYASLQGIDDQKKIVSPLYAADLIGGCLGSLLGSLVFIPLAGMDMTVWGMLVLAVFSILLV